MKFLQRYILFFLILSLFSCNTRRQYQEKEVLEEKIDYTEEANRLSRELIIADGHIDLPYRIERKWEDISQRTQGGHFDYVRAAEGGLNAPFMSIYIPASYQEAGGAKDYADILIDWVYEFSDRWPDKFAVAVSPEDIIEQMKAGLISLPMGIENGAALESDLANLKYFHDRGVRYITLCHSKWNRICDSSYDPDKHWNGLSPFGEKVIREMNRLGMMIDVSHISDSAFYQVMRLTEAPVIASHSACRYYTPGFERNMSDDMIREMAAHGGVIHINFGSYFLDGDFRRKMEMASEQIRDHGLKRGSEEYTEYLEQFKIEHDVPGITVDHVVDHISHVAAIVGVDHIGLGSDFDGVSHVPEGLSDVSMYPNLIRRLLEDGFTEEDIRKICAGNLFRVWNEVEEVAERLNGSM